MSYEIKLRDLLDTIQGRCDGAEVGTTILDSEEVEELEHDDQAWHEIKKLMEHYNLTGEHDSSGDYVVESVGGAR